MRLVIAAAILIGLTHYGYQWRKDIQVESWLFYASQGVLSAFLSWIALKYSAR